jgi:hypothetical protein
MSPDSYYSWNPTPGADGETFDITMDSLNVGKLQRQTSDIPGAPDWVLSARGPLSYEDTTFPGSYDEARAVRDATGWVQNHVTTERPDLLED